MRAAYQPGEQGFLAMRSWNMERGKMEYEEKLEHGEREERSGTTETRTAGAW